MIGDRRCSDVLFIPLFIQGVIGTSATQSGTVLTPMMFAMIGSSVSAARRGPAPAVQGRVAWSV